MVVRSMDGGILTVGSLETLHVRRHNKEKSGWRRELESRKWMNLFLTLTLLVDDLQTFLFQTNNAEIVDNDDGERKEDNDQRPFI